MMEARSSEDRWRMTALPWDKATSPQPRGTPVAVLILKEQSAQLVNSTRFISPTEGSTLGSQFIMTGFGILSALLFEAVSEMCGLRKAVLFPTERPRFCGSGTRGCFCVMCTASTVTCMSLGFHTWLRSPCGRADCCSASVSVAGGRLPRHRSGGSSGWLGSCGASQLG